LHLICVAEPERNPAVLSVRDATHQYQIEKPSLVAKRQAAWYDIVADQKYCRGAYSK
jgi:hypothetical protein